MATRKLNEDDINVLRSYAKNNMNANKTAKEVFYATNSVHRCLDKIHIITGKNPRNFYELHELINMFNERKND